MWLSYFEHQNLTIALSLVSSFTNDSIFFMENVNPIYLVTYLFSYSQFVVLKDCVKWKKKSSTYNQSLLSVDYKLSSNLNNNFCSSLV